MRAALVLAAGLVKAGWVTWRYSGAYTRHAFENRDAWIWAAARCSAPIRRSELGPGWGLTVGYT